MIPGTYTIPTIVRGDSWDGISSLQILLADGDPISAVATAATNILTAATHGLANGEIVTVATTAGGLTASRRYYVVTSTANTFQLALTAGGAAVDLTTSATHSLQLQTPPGSDLLHAKIQFRREGATGSVGLELTDENGGIVIDDADAWIISVPAQDPPTRAGVWYWDLETETTDGTIRTYVGGEWEILQDVTRIS